MRIASHPNGIRPAGNAAQSATSQQNFLARLPDELILLLFQDLPLRDLIALSHTCKKLYAFSLLEELWKDLYVDLDSKNDWKGSWRNTMLKLDQGSEVEFKDTCSDLLYKPYLNTQLDLLAHKPSNSTKSIARFRTLSKAEFENHVHIPFILTEEIKGWKACQTWTTDTLLERFDVIKFRAECLDWSLRQYVHYMKNNQDESPLYLFDSHFAEKTTTHSGSLADEYCIPACFREDIFSILEDDRPDHRWLIIGPARSGSTFHKDPNGTCAWNAVITGSKLWIMFPPDIAPPGVYVSADEAEVTSPLSIAEWLMTYHKEAQHTHGYQAGICHAGEILYVPSGWWHLVVNLEECIAVTQNFVPRAYTGKVYRFLKHKVNQVSGFRKDIDALRIFSDRLQTAYPDLWHEFVDTQPRPNAWEALKSSSETSSAFSFNFDHSSDEE